MDEKHMIRVGFIGAESKNWIAGLHYLKNLLCAIKAIENSQIEPVVFLGTKTDEEIKEIFRQLAQVVEHPIFDHKSLYWFTWKSINRFFNTPIVLERVLHKYNIQVLSHIRSAHADIAGSKLFKTISWIPDFQHLYLPQMFTGNEIEKRNKNYMQLAKKSDLVILSSFSAMKDFSKFAPKYVNKGRVLQFVSQPYTHYSDKNEEEANYIRKLYNIDKPFFYVPNQFWAHKNHMLLFQAIKILTERKKDICIVCTGQMHDYRNPKYSEELINYIKNNKLENQIRLLGLLPYKDVFILMKYSIAVINPSLFEGWSSTVEECKSIAKQMILSDLDVHKEQYPNAYFFNRNSPESLAALLSDYSPEHRLFSGPINILERTKSFGQQYENIIREVIVY